MISSWKSCVRSVAAAVRVDVRVAEHGSPNRHAGRRAVSGLIRKSSTAAANVRGRSRFERCAVVQPECLRPGNRLAISRSLCGLHGMDTSRSPPMTSVGARMGSRSSRSGPCRESPRSSRHSRADRWPGASAAIERTIGAVGGEHRRRKEPSHHHLGDGRHAALERPSRRRFSMAAGSVSRGDVLARTSCVSRSGAWTASH